MAGEHLWIWKKGGAMDSPFEILEGFGQIIIFVNGGLHLCLERWSRCKNGTLIKLFYIAYVGSGVN
jgi:hypothetical protein